jgi:hypothetical protein
MTAIRCDGCGLSADVTVLRPQGGLALQVNVDNVSIDEYAKICRVAKERGRAPAVLLDCPHLKQTIDAAIAAGQL